MAINFDYDPEEIVRIGTRDITLRTAVLEYVEEQKKDIPSGHVMLPPVWYRDHGKRPGAFDAQHIEALARLLIFAKP